MSLHLHWPTRAAQSRAWLPDPRGEAVHTAGASYLSPELLMPMRGPQKGDLLALASHPALGSRRRYLSSGVARDDGIKAQRSSQSSPRSERRELTAHAARAAGAQAPATVLGVSEGQLKRLVGKGQSRSQNCL